MPIGSRINSATEGMIGIIIVQTKGMNSKIIHGELRSTNGSPWKTRFCTFTMINSQLNQSRISKPSLSLRFRKWTNSLPGQSTVNQSDGISLERKECFSQLFGKIFVNHRLLGRATVSFSRL